MEQLIIMSEGVSNQSNLKQLFDQFKFHLIYKNKPKQAQNSSCQQLKNLLSEIKGGCNEKRKKIKYTNEALHHIESTQMKTRPSSTLQSRIWKPKQINLDSLQAVKEQVLIIQKQKQTLMTQICELQASLSVIKKNAAQVKKKVEIESAKGEKYKHISYLTKSIQRNTETTKIINYRSFKKLVKYQQDALSNLKKFKSTLRKDNEDLQVRYLQFKQKQQNQEALKNKMDFTSNHIIKMDTNSDFKIDKSFFNKLQELITLFSEKQANFQEIKSQQTTRIRLKKIQKSYLKQERVKLHEMIDRFEQYHDVKIQSLPNLILYIYKHLNNDNQKMENQCIKHYQIKQILLEDMEKLKEKQQQLKQKTCRYSPKQFKYETQKKNRIIKNSQIFVKFVVLLHNLLGKFKYLFTMALTLNIEKKNFQELLIQITKIYKSDSIFYQKDVQDSNIIDDNLTNFKQMEQILSQYESKSSFNKNDLLSLIFNDLRYTLMFRRCWLEQQLKDSLEEKVLLQKISSIQQKCQETYDSKIKIYIHLFINSLKALAMNKYQRKIICNSNVRDSLFLSISKPIKIFSCEENEEPQSIRSKKSEIQERKFSELEQCQESNQVQFKDNPRKIINLLEELKNEEKKNFKPFYFEPGQVYMYDNKIVLPKYVF